MPFNSPNSPQCDSANWADLLALQGIVVPEERHDEFDRNHHDLRTLVAVIRSSSLALQPWTAPALPLGESGSR